ncbi:MAG: hypothetical protein AB7G09_02835 [Pseudonocardia sp.]
MRGLMPGLLGIGRRVGHWILDGLATDHTWCWGYVFGAPASVPPPPFQKI